MKNYAKSGFAQRPFDSQTLFREISLKTYASFDKSGDSKNVSKKMSSAKMPKYHECLILLRNEEIP